MSSMKAASARSSRARAPESTTNREPESLAARSKSIRPSASPISKCCRAPPSTCAGSPQRLISTLALSSSPSGTSGAGRLGRPDSSLSSLTARAFSSCSSFRIPSLNIATSATRSDTSWPRPRAAPICFDFWLRSLWIFWNAVWIARRCASRSCTSAAFGSTPRRARPASNAAPFSRIHRALNITAALVTLRYRLSIRQRVERVRALSYHPTRNSALMPVKQGKMDVSAFTAATGLPPRILPTIRP